MIPFYILSFSWGLLVGQMPLNMVTKVALGLSGGTIIGMIGTAVTQ